MSAPQHDALIHKVLGDNYLPLRVVRLAIDEHIDDGSTVKLVVAERDVENTCEGKGVGVVDAIYNALLARYAQEYESLKTLRLAKFQVAADMDTKKGQAGLDAVGRVTLDVANSEGRHFAFTDASRSITASTARVVVAVVQYFLNAERAFVTLHNARRDALARGREDLVARYTAEMSEVVESTSYAQVIENIRRSL